MKDKVKFVSAVLAASVLLAASAGALVVTGLAGSEEEAMEEGNKPDTESLYMVMDVDGNIGVYYRQALLYSTDISVYGLPESDQRQLQEGVRVETYGQVLSLLEDYSS